MQTIPLSAKPMSFRAYRFLPPLLSKAASSTIRSNPSGFKCSPSCINRTIAANVSKVVSLTRKQWILLKVRNNLQHQIGNTADFVFDGLVRPIRPNRTTLKSTPEYQQYFGAIRVLADRKAGTYIPAKPVATAFVERHTKAAFTVSVTRQIRFFIHWFSADTSVLWNF